MEGRSSSPAEPFEFRPSSAGSPEMCSACEVISGGKLLPFGAPPPPLPAKTGKTYRRSVSMGEQPKGCLWGGKVTAAEYRRLRPVTDPDPIRMKARWYLLVFGSVKIPAGMEMKEIRIRQQRLSDSPAAAGWGPWKLLRSLSCKGVEVAGDCHRHIVL